MNASGTSPADRPRSAAPPGRPAEWRSQPARPSSHVRADTTRTGRGRTGAETVRDQVVDADRQLELQQHVRRSRRRRRGSGRRRPARPSRNDPRVAVRFVRATGSIGAARRIGMSTDSLMTSSASVTRVAPCLMRSLVPSARGSSGEPGTANTSRPCSSAMRAVISEPERCAASTITTPTAQPGNQPVAARESRAARGSQPSGISEIAAPPASTIRVEQVRMLGRIDAVVAAGEHRDRAACRDSRDARRRRCRARARRR